MAGHRAGGPDQGGTAADPPDGSGPRWQVSRRTVLQWGGVATAGLVVVGISTDEPTDEQQRALLLAAQGAPTVRMVARGDDGLLLALSFVNLGVLPARPLGPGPQLALIDPAAPGYVVLGLQPQSVVEQAYFNATAAPTPPVPAIVSGPSRLVLKVQPRSAPIAYDLPTLLNLVTFPLAVSTVADSGSVGPPPPPGPTDTAIEAPWRLFLSPPSSAAFSAARAPVTRNGRTELWHARAVAGRLADGSADQRVQPVPVRAIWSPDLAGGTPLTGPPWALPPENSVALTVAQRDKLVRATTTPNPPGDTTHGGPAAASLLLVSPMGASLTIDGAWRLRSDVRAWKHRSWLGRDNYVKVDEPGFLFPFGFRATRVSITERVLEGGNVAFLRKKEFVVVREPTIDFPGPGQPNQGKNLPFTSATTTTLVSPPLSPNRDAIGTSGAFWVTGPADADLLRYRLTLTTRDRGLVTADLPMVFVPADRAFQPGITGMEPIIAGYNAADAGKRRTLVFDGQKLGFVEPAAGVAEETALPTFDLVLTAEPSTGVTAQALEAEQRVNGYPKMATAEVRLEVLDAVGGTQVNRTKIELSDKYTAGDLGTPPTPGEVPKNPGEVWANVVPPPPNVTLPRLEVPQQIGGGLAAPSLDVKGLSRVFGPVADPGKIAEGRFDPGAYFPLDEITLLGGIPLKSVLAAVPTIPIPDPRGPQNQDDVPKVVTVRSGNTVDTFVTWRPILKATGDNLFVPGLNNRLELKAVFHTDATGATSTRVTGDLRNVTLNFIGTESPLAFIEQNVTRLHFESRDGAKPTVDVQLGPSTFKGELAFLADLQSKLPALPGGIKIEQTPRGVSAGLSIAIPTVAVGVVLVQNLAIGVLLDLPFNGDQAVLRFNFATREHPFQVTVSALGGGGFLAIGLGTRGVQQIEGSLEFGAAVALDLGVASGSVSIMAGIYFKYAQKLDAAGNPREPKGDTVVIAGYVRAIGTLDVLGLIHISVEFYLGLTFTSKQGPGTRAKVEGTATLVVRVEVLLFSTSVSLTVHKEFGAGPDPNFGQQITASDWATYCAAFAAA